jgi:hypothetical protein
LVREAFRKQSGKAASCDWIEVQFHGRNGRQFAQQSAALTGNLSH